MDSCAAAVSWAVAMGVTSWAPATPWALAIPCGQAAPCAPAHELRRFHGPRRPHGFGDFVVFGGATGLRRPNGFWPHWLPGFLPSVATLSSAAALRPGDPVGSGDCGDPRKTSGRDTRSRTRHHGPSRSSIAMVARMMPHLPCVAVSAFILTLRAAGLLPHIVRILRLREQALGKPARRRRARDRERTDGLPPPSNAHRVAEGDSAWCVILFNKCGGSHDQTRRLPCRGGRTQGAVRGRTRASARKRAPKEWPMASSTSSSSSRARHTASRANMAPCVRRMACTR